MKAYNKGYTKQIKRPCFHCGKMVEYPLHIVKKGWGKFCNRSCAARFNNNAAKKDKHFAWWQSAYNLGVKENLTNKNK